MTRARPGSRPMRLAPPARELPAPTSELAEALTGLSRQNSVYRRTIAVCDQLADTALKGVNPAELTRVFADLVGKRIVLMDPAFRSRAQSGGDGELPDLTWDRGDPSVDRLLTALRAGIITHSDSTAW